VRKLQVLRLGNTIMYAKVVGCGSSTFSVIKGEKIPPATKTN